MFDDRNNKSLNNVDGFRYKVLLKRILAKINVFRSSILSCGTRFNEFINDHCTHTEYYKVMYTETKRRYILIYFILLRSREYWSYK